MGEGPLPEDSRESGREEYRLLVEPVFRPPFMVRLIIMHDGSGYLVAKAGESQKNPVTLTLDRRTKVSKDEVDEFLRYIQEAKFWSMQTNQFYTKEQTAALRTPSSQRPTAGRRKAVQKVLGGVDWLLEGVQVGNYHVVTRTSLEPGPYASLTSFLFRNLAKLEIPPGSPR
jgi:hypothetical protein